MTENNTAKFQVFTTLKIQVMVLHMLACPLKTLLLYVITQCHNPENNETILFWGQHQVFLFHAHKLSHTDFSPTYSILHTYYTLEKHLLNCSIHL